MGKSMKLAVGIFLLAGLLLQQGNAAEFDRVFKSAVFPGMGQLGDDQTVKGLSFMGAEVLLITMGTHEWSKWTSYTRDTEYLSVKYVLDSTYALKRNTHEKWKESYDNSDKAQLMMMGYFAGAGLCYALNILDAVLFPPAPKAETIIPAVQQSPAQSAPAKAEPPVLKPAVEEQEEAPAVENEVQEERAKEPDAPEAAPAETTAPDSEEVKPEQESSPESESQQEQESKPEGESLLRKIHDNTRIAISPTRSSINYVFQF